MDKAVCRNCKKEFKSEASLHKHLKAHGLRMAEYYQQYYPRHDLYDGKLIKFKNKEYYFSSDFNSRTNLKMWLKQAPEDEAKKYCINLLKTRKKAKNLVYAQSQVELRTLMLPPIYYYELFETIKTDGWSNEYPATIAIGDNKEIFIHGGNHRINFLTLLNVCKVPVSLVYMKDIKPSPTAHKLLTTSESFYPKGLLPKWELNK